MKRHRAFIGLWALGLTVVATLMIYFKLRGEPASPTRPEPAITPLVFAALALLAFLCEAVDSSLGMGYGTTLTPVLLTAGFHPLSVVPAALLSQLMGGVLAGLLHHTYGNVDLRHSSAHARVMYLLAGSGIVGGILAIRLATWLPEFYVKLYVGILVLAIGVFVWISPRLGDRLSYRRVLGLGLLAAFNKGMSAGGYGPVVTGGQVLAGVNSKAAVGITAAAEAVTCVAALAALYVLGKSLNWSLAVPLCLGAVSSAPVAVNVVKTLPHYWVQRAIAIGCMLLGTMTLVNLVA